MTWPSWPDPWRAAWAPTAPSTWAAARDAITSVRERRRLVLPGLSYEALAPASGDLALLSAEGSHGFRATVVPVDASGAPLVSKACREALGVETGHEVLVTPLP